VAVTGRGRTTLDDDRQSSSEVPWHNRTPEVIGASLLGLAAIALIVFAVSFVARQFGEPEQAPLNFVDPSFSSRTTAAATTTTTQTITSTSPPITSDINNPADSSSSSTSSSTSNTSGTSSSETSTSGSRTTAATDSDEPTTTRTTRRPRTNVTRTLYPPP
jgi:hypothetical protein